MTDINPIERIKELCAERNWSYYQLAKSSDLPYSTLSTLLNSTNLPSLTTLAKICSGFGMFNALPDEKKQLAIAYMKGLKGDI